MADNRTNGYAQAMLNVAAAEGNLAQVEDELYRFARAFEANPDLGRQLGDSAIDLQTRTGIVTDLLDGRAHPQTINAVSYIVQAGRSRQLPEIADAVVTKAATSRSRGVAEVRSAVPLDDEQVRRLAAALQQSSGQHVDVKVVVDPDVVGGLLVRIGDTVIDGTVARRLQEMRTALTGG